MLNIYGFTSDEYQNKCRNDDNFLVSYDEYETTDCDWIETTLAENGSCDEECSSVSECYCRTQRYVTDITMTTLNAEETDLPGQFHIDMYSSTSLSGYGSNLILYSVPFTDDTFTVTCDFCSLSKTTTIDPCNFYGDGQAITTDQCQTSTVLSDDDPEVLQCTAYDFCDNLIVN